jgi:hypothetical protein
MLRLPVAGLLLWILACGGEDDGTGPGFASVNGTWSLSITDLSGGGGTCSTSEPIEISLQQSTTTFTGTYGGGGVLSCTGPFGSFFAAMGSGSVLNGEISGNQVSFDLGSSNFHQVGNVTGSSMGGTATWTFESGIASTLGELTGNWTAARQ